MKKYTECTITCCSVIFDSNAMRTLQIGQLASKSFLAIQILHFQTVSQNDSKVDNSTHFRRIIHITEYRLHLSPSMLYCKL